jgi:hypothetical protein
MRVEANADAESVLVNNNYYTRYQKTHTFFIRAVDGEGRRSDAVSRSFTAWTLAPYINITAPQQPASASTATLSRIIKFRWEGTDPIDDPGNNQEPDSVRYLYVKHAPQFDLVADLNQHPELYESRWSNWVWYRAPEDSGRQTILGDDEILELNNFYTFAVQAKDEAGAVTGIFDRRSNVRQFWVSKKAGPLLTVTEPFLGGFQFLGSNPRAEVRNLPPGVPLNFCWRADASSYGGDISGFRYGWDVADVNDDAAWETGWNPDLKCAPTKTLYSGVHRFYVQVIDNSGTKTLGIVEINIVQFVMDRNLLLIDDFY